MKKQEINSKASKKPISERRLKVALYDLDMNDIVSTWFLDPYKMRVPLNCNFHCPWCRNKCEGYENEVL